MECGGRWDGAAMWHGQVQPVATAPLLVPLTSLDHFREYQNAFWWPRRAPEWAQWAQGPLDEIIGANRDRVSRVFAHMQLISAKERAGTVRGHLQKPSPPQPPRQNRPPQAAGSHVCPGPHCLDTKQTVSEVQLKGRTHMRRTLMDREEGGKGTGARNEAELAN